jgi:phosphatidylserine decarboxylase
MNKYVRVEPSSRIAFPVARAGYPIIGVAAFVTAVFALLSLTLPALLGVAATLFICYFFRDPDRVIPDQVDAVVSPADGKVIKIEKVQSNRFYEGPCLKISIFMSIFNVHVNRIPYKGTVTRISYYPGKFFSANLDKASRDNEHNAIFLETGEGQKICFVQIAGLVARRIICNIQENDQVHRGRRFGMICFGSRLDVYLPPASKIKVRLGDRVSAGTSVLGELAA